MKKLILIAFMMIVLTACTVTEKKEVEMLIDATAVADVTVETAPDIFGEISYFGPYEFDGLKGELYTTEDGKELVFVGDGSKLRSIVLYPTDYHLETSGDIYDALGIKRSEKVKATGTHYYDLDAADIVREAAFTGDSPNFPMNVEIVQIWYR